MKKNPNFIEKKLIARNLWNEYTHNIEYIDNGWFKGIRDDHPMIIDKESMGLKSIYKTFVIEKLRSKNSIDSFVNRSSSDWLNEWKNMHALLLRFVLNKDNLGYWREIDVRFGAPEDEDRYKIPFQHMVRYEIEIIGLDKLYLVVFHLTN